MGAQHYGQSSLSRRPTSQKRTENVELVALRYIKITTALESTYKVLHRSDSYINL